MNNIDYNIALAKLNECIIYLEQNNYGTSFLINEYRKTKLEIIIIK